MALKKHIQYGADWFFMLTRLGRPVTERYVQDRRMGRINYICTGLLDFCKKKILEVISIFKLDSQSIG